VSAFPVMGPNEPGKKTAYKAGGAVL